MADFSKMKAPRRKNLPPAPSDAEIVGNLKTPEIAPVDGRSARATGRTMQLATRVHPDFHQELRLYAAQHRLKLVEVLEQAFDALKAKDS